MESMQSLQERKPAERHTALKVWIRWLIEGKFISNPGWESNYIGYNDMKIGRANIVGVVVQKSASKVLNYDYIVVDDGTGRIAVRAFEERQMLQDLQIGDLVNVIGKPREYGAEVYLVPEIARRIDDPLWAEVRKRELERVSSTIMQPAQERIAAKTAPQQPGSEKEEDDAIITPRDKLLTAIRALDDGNGVEVETILARSADAQAGKMLQGMLLRGDIFEVKPGRIKILE